MNPIERPPAIVRWTLRLEDATALDAPVQALEPPIRGLFGTGTRASVLRGDWLGHAVHPLLTDVVIGTWTSASAARPVRGTRLVRAGPAAHRRRSARRRPDRLDRMGGVVGGRAARQAGRPRPRRHQRCRDRRLRGVVGRPPAGPARRRGPAGPGRSGRLGSRRLPGRPPRGGTQGGQPPPRLRRGDGSAQELLPRARDRQGDAGDLEVDEAPSPPGERRHPLHVVGSVEVGQGEEHGAHPCVEQSLVALPVGRDLSGVVPRGEVAGPGASA